MFSDNFIEKIYRKNKCSLLFEPVGARAYIIKSNINFLNNSITSDG